MTCRPAATRAGRHVTLARRTGRRPSRERTSARTGEGRSRWGGTHELTRSHLRPPHDNTTSDCDRKSGVQGKSVSVGKDLGGGSSINKKRGNSQHNRQQQE